MKFIKVITFALVLVPIVCSAQKVKYKDLFPMLNSKNYTDGEPQLLVFLKDPKNAEHANAHLQMGLILDKRFREKDILGDTSAITQAADSAVQMFAKSLTLITEKELKKRDEYYQSFHRRDLRTGEFGIKLSDVQLDIEKKIESVRNRNKDIRTFNTMLHRIQGRYNLSVMIYKQMIERHGDYKELLFLLTPDDMVMLDRMRDNAQGLYALSNDLKKLTKDLGSDSYQGFNSFKFIETYAVDGLEHGDIFSGELDLWDYETWANSTKNDYSAVTDYKNIILDKENEISGAFEKIAQGVDPGTISLHDLEVDGNKYDEDGSARSLLDLRLNQLEVSRLSNPILSASLADSTNIFAQLGVADIIMEKLGSMNTIYSDISAPEKMDLAKLRYAGILETNYGGSTGYDQFVSDLGSWINNERLAWNIRAEEFSEKDKWAVSGEERIPLYEVTESQKYMTKGVHGTETKIAFGVDSETGEGFLVWSGPARGILKKSTMVIGEMDAESTVAKALPTPHFGCYFYDPSSEVNNFFILSTTTMGDLKWSNLITAPHEPVSFRYDESLDQLTVFYFPEDQLPDGEGIAAYVVIDRNGMVR
ncbi:MAG: hypothetical protein GY816_21785 [Cytophagales bacterium]|nr:hypothetical protein [Cytophagales bacterium]